ncbi:hypothetical protein ACJMK2_003364 [Sinanodonta woodiana]|uniref:Uncharacterized protein n=1 Tax=Sinanodonta woodiana TaxID=1069815 RepID=A0ABD3XZQ3_SINWO
MLGCLAVGCGCASLVTCIISVALPYWMYYQPPLTSDKSYFGLWILCGETAVLGKKCESIIKVTGYFMAVRALIISGLALIVGAVLGGAISFCVTKQSRRLAISARGLSSSAGVCMICGAVLFAAWVPDIRVPGAMFHAGFGLAIASGVLAIATSVLFYFATKTNSNPSES